MPLKDPEARRRYNAGHHAAHREEANARRRARRAAHLEEERTRHAAYYGAHREEERARNAAYRAAHREADVARSAAHYAAHRDERNAKTRASRAANPAKNRAQCANWYAQHREEAHARQAAYRVAHKEKVHAREAAYNASHREERRAYDAAHLPQGAVRSARRRATKRNAAVNDFTAAQWLSMQEHFQHCCAYCGKRAKGHLTQDHIQPLSKGGNHTLANIVPACQSCNSRKHIGPVLVPVQPLLLTVAPTTKTTRRA